MPRRAITNGSLFGPWAVDAGFVGDTGNEVRLTQLVVQVLLGTTETDFGEPIPGEPPDPNLPDPEGGGEGPDGIDPDPGVSICGAEVPLAWWEIETGGSPAVVHRYAKVPINVGTFPKEPRAKLLGRIRRRLSNQFSDLRGSTMQAQFIDVDRVLRDLEYGDSLVGSRASAYVSTEAAIRAQLTPRRVFDGVITDAKPRPGLLFDVTVLDYLSILLEQFSKKVYPQDLYTLADFPNMGLETSDEGGPHGNPAMLSKPVAIGYGLLSDESAATPQGIVPGIFTGSRTVDGYPWHEYVFLRHAPAAVVSLYRPIGLQSTERVRYDSTLGSDYLVPGSAPWIAAGLGAQTYRVINGKTYTVAYGRGPLSDLNRSGKVPLCMNLGGVEDVGDATGTMITGLYRQILHLINNFLIQHWLTGAWLPIPTVGEGAELYSRISSTTFAETELRSDRLVDGGINGAFLLGENGREHTLDEILTTAAINGHFDWGINKDGQIMIDQIDSTRPINRHLNALEHTLKLTTSSERLRDRIKNKVIFRYAKRYAPEPAKLTPAEGELLPPTSTEPLAEWGITLSDIDDPQSVEKYGERIFNLDAEMLRDDGPVAGVVNAILAEESAGPIKTAFTEGPCGTDTELGHVDGLTHFELLAEDERHLRCEEHDLDLDTWQVHKVYRDITDLEGSPGQPS